MLNRQKYKTSEERERAFIDFCDSYNECECENCPIIKLADSCGSCLFDWLELEAEEEKPLPCPLCGARMGVHGSFLKCTGCGLGFSYGLTTNDVTSAFNRVARSVIESDKLN